MRTSFHHQPEAQHPKSSAIHRLAGRLPHLLEVKRTCRERGERVDPTKMTRSGPKPGRNPALQQSPAVSKYAILRRSTQENGQ